ncbi:MAG: hypothetical protein V4534_00530 [Myxococcota bacterium]
MSTKTISQILVLGLILVVAACKPKLIANTSVKDNRSNRAVIAFMEEYRNAIVSRSVPDIMNLVSPDYSESNGTADPNDDYNYAQLQEKLEKTYAHVKEVTIRMHVQNIFKKDGNVNVFYFYNQHSLIAMPAGEQWTAVNDVNRLVLRPKDKSFEILSGL